MSETHNKVLPKKIVSVDVTNLTDDTGKKLIFIPCNEKHAGRIKDFSKISTLTCSLCLEIVLVRLYIMFTFHYKVL